MAEKVKLPTQAIEFSSERKQYTILELYHKHKKHACLPLVLKVRQGYYGSLLDRPLAKDEILVLAVASTQYRVMTRQDGFFKKRILSIPSSFIETVSVVDELTNTYDRECYMYSILQENKLPVFVRLPQNRVITVDRRHYDAKDIPGFYLEKRFDEITLQGNMILEGKVEENEILAVPIFLTELKVSIVNGIKGRPKKEWLAYQEKLRDICENVPYDFEYGSPKIAEYSQDKIEFDKDYAIVEPKCYVPIQDLVEIIPQEMMQQYLDEQEFKRKEAQEAVRKQLEYATFKDREQTVRIQEPPVVDNDDDSDSDYEKIELPPDIKPKPFIRSRAPVPTPVPEPVSIGKPPAPKPDSESDSESLDGYETPQHPKNQNETEGEHDLNTDKRKPPIPDKPNISISESPPSSPKKTKLPLLSEVVSAEKDLTEHPPPIPGKPNISFSETPLPSPKRPKLPLPSEGVAVDNEETKYPRPSNKAFTGNTKEHSDASKAKQIARELEMKTKALTKPKPKLYAKPKTRSSSQSEEATANLKSTETNKVTDLEEGIGTKRTDSQRKREPIIVRPQLKTPTEEKDLPPIPVKPKPPLRPAAEAKTGIISFPSHNALSSDCSYFPVVNRGLSVDESDKTDEYDDAYEYVGLSPSVQDKLVTRDKQDTAKTKDGGNELYENHPVPTLVVNPVKSLPKQNTESDAITNITLEVEETCKVKNEHNDAKIEVASLTVEDVCDYLEKLHLEKYSDMFIANMVDGVLLLTLDEDVLTNDFDMKKIEALRLLRFAREGTLPKLRQN